MRMRKKKYLDTRFENCQDYLIDTYTEERDFNKVIEETEYIDYEELFGDNNPVRLEIGCGKGQFAVEIAKREPEVNFIAVEKDKNVIVAAIEKAKAEELKNLKFINGCAEYLPRFVPEHSVELIYLNFSCPFPKNRAITHRLTHRRFLERYKLMLKHGGEIHQKTDNMHFFEFSLSEFSQCEYKLQNISLDLHKSDFEGNIVTEYEKRFSDMGMPIYRLEAVYE